MDMLSVSTNRFSWFGLALLSNSDDDSTLWLFFWILVAPTGCYRPGSSFLLSAGVPCVVCMIIDHWLLFQYHMCLWCQEKAYQIYFCNFRNSRVISDMYNQLCCSFS